jgi:hypothetical protein
MMQVEHEKGAGWKGFGSALTLILNGNPVRKSSSKPCSIHTGWVEGWVLLGYISFRYRDAA